MQVPIARFLTLVFISRFFNSKEELRRDTFRRRLCRGGGTRPVFNTYVVAAAAVAVVAPDRTRTRPASFDEELRWWPDDEDTRNGLAAPFVADGSSDGATTASEIMDAESISTAVRMLATHLLAAAPYVYAIVPIGEIVERDPFVRLCHPSHGCGVTKSDGSLLRPGHCKMGIYSSSC